MAIRKIEHLGIAVTNPEAAEILFSKLLGKTSYKKEKVDSQGVLTTFFELGESKIELLESLTDDSSIKKFIDKKGGGIHHIALDVDDIEFETQRLKKEGFEFIYEKASEGADNKLINFIHPRSAAGILIELCQEKK
jgi:methylmalonyl-CoA/ethylmalonyl-CoA epimerase